MKNTSWSLFTYPVMDIKAAEALLNRRAAEGWTLDRVWLGAFAHFVPAGAPEVWCVDWSRPGYSERPDYLALCADAGWTLVQKVGAFNLYKAPPGTPPIQTDGEEETRRFRREVLRAFFKGWGILLALLLVLAALVLLVSRASWRGISMDLLLTNTGLFLLLSLPAILATCLLWTGRLLLRLRQWGRSAGDPLPAPRRTSAWAAAWLCLFCRLWGVAVTLCFLLDAGRYIRFGSALGMLLGGCIGLYLNRNRRDREGRKRDTPKGTVLLYRLILLSVLLFAPVLSPLADVLMPAPVLVEETFVPGAERVDRGFSRRVSYADTDLSSTGSFGLRYQSWWEDPSGEVYEVDCYAARWEWLARLVLDIKRESWYPPVKDRPHVWLHEADLGGGKTESALLLRVGKTVVMVETRDGPIPMEQIDRLVNILSSAQEKSPWH